MGSERDTKADELMREMRLAMANVMEAQREHDKAYDGYDGHSWDYFGRDLIDAVEKAEREMSDAMQAVVLHMVSAALTPNQKG